MNLTDGIPDDGSGFGNVDIKTQFNVNLGKPGCLDGTPFYLGLDGNAGSKVNFVGDAAARARPRARLFGPDGADVDRLPRQCGRDAPSSRLAACPASGKASCSTTRRARRGWR